VILMASGTEVGLIASAYEQLMADGVRARAVSMPSWKLFERQPAEYRESVLPPKVTARVAVEQASAFGWDRYVGLTGTTIAMRSFGMSAPLKDLQRQFGFTTEAVVAAARAQISGEPASTNGAQTVSLDQTS
jgi:transketolase